MVDLPDVPPEYAQVMIVQASQAQQSAGKTDLTIGVCKLVGNPMRFSAINGVGAVGAALGYFHNIGELLDVGSGAATVLSHPRNGTLKPRADSPGGYLYLPKPDYFGSDRATFLVEMGGKKIRVEYFFKVLDGVADGDYQDKEFCPRGIFWKISLNPDDSNGGLISFQHLKTTRKLPDEP